jgi:hypothetical protein
VGSSSSSGGGGGTVSCPAKRKPRDPHAALDISLSGTYRQAERCYEQHNSSEGYLKTNTNFEPSLLFQTSCFHFLLLILQLLLVFIFLHLFLFLLSFLLSLPYLLHHLHLLLYILFFLSLTRTSVL